jgi:type II secretory pathway component PulF
MSATPSAKASRGRMILLLVLHAICGAVLVYLLLGFVPKSEKVFRDFDLKLPAAMLTLIDVSRRFAAKGIGPAACLGAGDLAVMLLLHRLGRARLMTAWGVCLWLAEIALIALILAGVVTSMSNMTRAL